MTREHRLILDQLINNNCDLDEGLATFLASETSYSYEKLLNLIKKN